MNNLDTLFKEEMLKTIEELNPSNIEFQRTRINRLFYLYGEINELFPKEDPYAVTSEGEKFIPTSTAPAPKIKQVKEYVDKENKILVGHLERGLVGGTIKVKDVSVFVPERVIRELGYKHGDILKAYYRNLDKVNYEKVADSTTEHLNKRMVVRYAIVSDEFLDGELVANRAYVNGEKTYIRLDGETPFTFVITDYEKEKYKLLPGDLIEFAYFKDYPQTYKVVWKYNSYEVSHLNDKKLAKA